MGILSCMFDFFLLWFSCTHGLTSLKEDEIMAEYGQEKKWPLFADLKEKVYHGSTYKNNVWFVECSFFFIVCLLVLKLLLWSIPDMLDKFGISNKV